ncbi:MAG: hypothetical protein ACI9YT_001572 [Halobacteriales archaeon]|jgi:hypothetical protein
MADPTGSQQVGFWLLLGLTSTAFAEGLFPTTAFDPATMALFAVPIYLLHSVVLAGVVCRADGVRYQTLYLAGVLLGLYEAYVTKVVWAPLGDRPVLEVGGVYLFETVGLVLFWHPVVAFLLPVAVVETVATASDRSLRPPLAGHRFARPLVGAVALSLLLFQGSLGGPVRALLGNAVALSILLVGLFVWRRTDGHTHDMQALLPGGRTLGVLAVCLVGVAIGLGAVIRPEALPTRPMPHLLVLVMYLVAGGLLAVLLRGDKPPSASVSVGVTWRRILTGSGAILLGSPVLGGVGASLALLVFLSYYAVAVGVGAASLGAVALVLRS